MNYKELISNRANSMYFPDFEDDNSSRRWYQHDIDLITYSSMYRKMQRKSQLFSMKDPVFRSRLIHTVEVVRIAKEISEKLDLNIELTEAIALAHDFGNVAYGKAADDFLKKQTNNTFKHEEISVLMLKVYSAKIIPDRFREQAKNELKKDIKTTHTIKINSFPYEIEVFKYKDNYYYICVTPETLDGIIKHGTNKPAFTLEGQVVNYADNISYLIQDINDFEITGIFNKHDTARYGRCLNEFLKNDNNTRHPVSSIVGKNTSIRTATLIERFVSHNQNLLINNSYETVFSAILGEKIPILEIDEITKKAIDKCWKFKEEFYEKTIIKLSNIASEHKLKQIWEILDDESPFVKSNKSYNKFIELLDSPIFLSYKEKTGIDEGSWINWKKAYFISNLTCDEIDLIINSYLERDYVFELFLPNIN